MPQRQAVQMPSHPPGQAFRTPSDVRQASVTTFALRGPGCLGCAKDVEDAINHLPGVLHVDLDASAGRLTVVGQADVEVIRQITRLEGWDVTPFRHGDPARPRRLASTAAAAAKPWWQQTRQVLLAISAGLLCAGLLGEWTGFAVRLGELGVPHLLYAAAILVGMYIPARSALRSLRRQRLTINTLLVVGSLGAIGLGLWEEAASLVVIFSLGEVLEVYAADRTRRALKALTDLIPPEAIVLEDGAERTVSVEDVTVGQLVRVKPGSRVPLDGVVVDGASAIDQSSITGESMPVDKAPGDEVLAGTMNQNGVLTVRATAAAGATTLDQIIRTVEEARQHKSSYEHFGERFGAIYTPAMFVLAVLVAAAPPLLWHRQTM